MPGAFNWTADGFGVVAAVASLFAGGVALPTQDPLHAVQIAHLEYRLAIDLGEPPETAIAARRRMLTAVEEFFLRPTPTTSLRRLAALLELQRAYEALQAARAETALVN